MLLDINTANPIAFILQPLDHVSTDKSACPAYQCLFHIVFSPFSN